MTLTIRMAISISKETIGFGIVTSVVAVVAFMARNSMAVDALVSGFKTSEERRANFGQLPLSPNPCERG
jgi:hypothetical protein